MIRFHVDDVMSSHINPKVNGNIDEWLQAKYREHGKVKAHWGKVHDYLGMIFEYSYQHRSIFAAGRNSPCRYCSTFPSHL